MTLNNKCPSCGSFINIESMKCKCGWKGDRKEAFTRPFVFCAYEGCPHEAIVRISNANLCKQHYIHEGDKQAAVYAQEHGLKTREDHVNHVRRLMKSFGSNHRAWAKSPKSPIAARFAEEAFGKVEREPGSDDERLAA